MNELTLTRRFAASRDLVFDFVTKPENLVLWWGHDGCTLENLVLDFTRLGPWNSRMVMADGSAYLMSGDVVEVTAPEIVRFTWAWHDADGTRGHESQVAFRLVEEGDETVFTLHHSGFPDAETAKAHNAGWSAVLVRLDRAFPQ